MGLSITTVLGAMRLVELGAVNADFRGMGVAKADYDRFVSDQPWTADDRILVTRVFDCLCYGVMDIVAIPRIELPAEYVAAIIRTFVSPNNYFTACQWGSSLKAADDMDQGREPIQPHQLFALLVRMSSEEYESPVNIRAAWEKKHRINVKKLTEKEAAVRA